MRDHGLDAIIDGLDVIGLLDVLRVEPFKFLGGGVDGYLKIEEVVIRDAVRIFGGRTERGDFAG